MQTFEGLAFCRPIVDLLFAISAKELLAEYHQEHLSFAACIVDLSRIVVVANIACFCTLIALV
jgi:hypothetical protein